MDGISVSEAYSVQQFAIVVDSGRAPYYLVTSVAIDIAHRDVVVAIAIHGVAPKARRAGWSGIGLCRSLAVSDLVGCLAVRTVEPACGQL